MSNFWTKLCDKLSDARKLYSAKKAIISKPPIPYINPTITIPGQVAHTPLVGMESDLLTNAPQYDKFNIPPAFCVYKRFDDPPILYYQPRQTYMLSGESHGVEMIP